MAVMAGLKVSKESRGRKTGGLSNVRAKVGAGPVCWNNYSYGLGWCPSKHRPILFRPEGFLSEISNF